MFVVDGSHQGSQLQSDGGSQLRPASDIAMWTFPPAPEKFGGAGWDTTSTPLDRQRGIDKHVPI